MIESRIRILKAMHELMIAQFDEDFYDHWVTQGVPDQPSEEDYQFIAQNDEEYYEVVEFFRELMIKDWKEMF